jgi:hypothetical protein
MDILGLGKGVDSEDCIASARNTSVASGAARGAVGVIPRTLHCTVVQTRIGRKRTMASLLAAPSPQIAARASAPESRNAS